VPLAAGIAVTTEATAIAAAERFTGPIALRADVPGLPRTSDAGAVVPGLHNADDIWRGFRSLQDSFGERLTAVIIQPMITGGVEVTISMLHEQVLGPLVLLGPGRAPPMHWLTEPPGSPRLPTPTPTTSSGLYPAHRCCPAAAAPPPPTSPR
jgi:acyl-CoA synthetase (NDP forming)